MSDALWLNKGVSDPSYTAAELRRGDAAVLFPGVTDSTGARGGVRPGHTPASLVSTTWTVHDIVGAIYPGLTTTSGPYRFQHAEESGSLDPADGTNDRIDALDLQIRDNDEDGSGFRDSNAVYTAGVPGASPSAPAQAANSIRLATILVPAGGTPAPTLTVVAPWTVASGGILPVRDATELPTAGRYEGMAAYNQAADGLQVWDGTTWPFVGSPESPAIEVSTSSGTFDIANYPWAKGIMVWVCGAGGGGGGGQVTTAGQGSFGDGGSAGGTAKKWIPVGLLSASEAVDVGAGGVGGDGGFDGNDGGSSSFGAHCTGNGGRGGRFRPAGTSQVVASSATGNRLGGAATGGDVNIRGGPASSGLSINPATAIGVRGGDGGSSMFGGGAVGNTGGTAGANATNGFGSGGAGAANHENQVKVKAGDGANGIVIVQIF